MSKHKLSPKEKSIIALEAIKRDKTLNEIASIYQIDPKLASKYKRHLENNVADIFTSKPKKEELEKDKLIEELYKIIGQRDIELEWLKKKLQIIKS